MIKNYKLVFFGTPEFAVPALKALLQEGYNVVAVVTQPDKPVGRKQVLSPSPVKVEAQNQNLDVIEVLKTERLKDYQADVGVVVAYGKIIPQEILDLFPLGCLNIHPSLLPKYRGPSPIQTAILNGDAETGVSIIKLDEQMDHGEIISKFQIPISNNDTPEILHDKLSVEGAKLLVKTLPDYISGKIKPIPQDDSLATFTKILKREDGEIDWSMPATEIERQIRAYYPWPGSFVDIRLKDRKTVRLKILSAKVIDDNLNSEIGQFQNKNGQLVVRSGRNSLIIKKLQPEGKKEMADKEFINGYMI